MATTYPNSGRLSNNKYKDSDKKPDMTQVAAATTNASPRHHEKAGTAIYSDSTRSRAAAPPTQRQGRQPTLMACGGPKGRA